MEIYCTGNRFVSLMCIPEVLNNGVVRQIIDDAKGGLNMIALIERYKKEAEADISPDVLEEYQSAIKVHCVRLKTVKEWIIENDKEKYGELFVSAWYKVIKIVCELVMGLSINHPDIKDSVYRCYVSMAEMVNDILYNLDLEMPSEEVQPSSQESCQAIGQEEPKIPEDSQYKVIPESGQTPYKIEDIGQLYDIFISYSVIVSDIPMKDFIDAVRYCQFEKYKDCGMSPTILKKNAFIYGISTLWKSGRMESGRKKEYRARFENQGFDTNQSPKSMTDVRKALDEFKSLR